VLTYLKTCETIMQNILLILTVISNQYT